MAALDFAFIARSLGLPLLPEEGTGKIRSKYWCVLDQEPDTSIVLLHYENDALPNILADTEFTPLEKYALLQLRGLIIDASNGRVLCRSFGYTPTVTLDSLPETTITAKDTKGGDVVFEPNECIYQPCYEGTLIRCWKYQGKTHYSTHRRIDATRSHWGSSKSFTELYKSLGGPSDDELFTDKPSSNFCSIFLLSHPDLLMATKIDVGIGFLVFLRHIQLNSTFDDPNTEYHKAWSGMLSVPDVINENDEEDIPVPPPTMKDEKSAIYAPPKFGAPLDGDAPGRGLRIANLILSHGYSNREIKSETKVDYRLLPGEPLICLTKEGRMIKITPRCYNWRTTVCGNNPNHFHRYHQLIDYSLTGEKEKKGDGDVFDGTEREYGYDELFPHIGTPDDRQLEAVLAEGPLYAPPKVSGDVADKDPRDLRTRNITLCYMMAVPLHVQKQIVGDNTTGEPSFYYKVNMHRADIQVVLMKKVDPLKRILNKPVELARYRSAVRSLESHSDALTFLVEHSIVLASKTFSKTPVFDKNGKRISKDDIREQIETLMKAIPGERNCNFFAGNKIASAGQAVIRLVSQSYLFALKNRKDASSKESKVPYNIAAAVAGNLCNLLRKERGTSLYGISRAILNPRVRKPKPSSSEESKTPVVETDL